MIIKYKIKLIIPTIVPIEDNTNRLDAEGVYIAPKIAFPNIEVVLCFPFNNLEYNFGTNK